MPSATHAFTLAALALALIAQARDTTRNNDSNLLANLASETHATRQQTTETLLANDLLSQEYIARLYEKSTLPEQRHRLLKIARNQFIRQVRLEQFPTNGEGAIGIRRQPFTADRLPQLNQHGILVVDTLPGFPGHAHLRSMDLILAIDNKPFPNDLNAGSLANAFVQTIQQKGAGTTTRFTIFRNGQIINLQFPLANLEALQGIYQLDGAIQKPYEQAWLKLRQHLDSLHPNTPRTLPSETTPPEKSDTIAPHNHSP